MRATSFFRGVQLVFTMLCFHRVSAADKDIDDINKSDEELYTMVTQAGIYTYVAFVSSKAGLCTATIINEDWVLTAASCCYFRNSQVNDRDLHIMAGIADYEYYDTSTKYVSTSMEIHVHPGYWEDRPGKFDVALIKVRDPFVFNEYVSKIAVSGEGWPQSKDPAQNCMALGFGGYHSTTPATTNLKVWNMTAVHSETACPCLKRFQWKRLVCVKEETHPLTCMGDTGGPLICGNTVRAISHMVLNRITCDPDDTTAPTIKCVNGPEPGLTMFFFLCVVNDWMHSIVEEIPARPESCLAVNVLCSLELIMICLLAVAW